MSYAMSAALQTALYDALTADPALQAEVSADIYDALPSGDVPDLYVAIGPETVRDASDKTGQGAWHEFTVSVVSQAQGFASAKRAAGAISDVLVGNPLPLSRGRTVAISFWRAKAVRTGTGDARRIDLFFRARLDDVSL